MSDLITRRRLQYINFGIKESRKRFEESFLTKESPPINAALSELLFWLVTADEWHLKSGKVKSYKSMKSQNEGGRCIFGLRGAFNSLKHTMSFIKLIRPSEGKELIKGSGLFMEDYSKDLVWLNAKGLLDESPKWKRQFENYQNYLEGKKVLQTIDYAISFLDSVYSEIRKEEMKHLS